MLTTHGSCYNISVNVLGIETSCDETSAAVVADGTQVLSHVVASQMMEHARYGGVVPEVASRRHVESINIVLRQTLKEANLTFSDLGAIAVTNRPGLLGALLVGVTAAKTLAQTLSLPLIGVHHIEAHLYANFLNVAKEDHTPDFPAVALVVSGGHTDLFHLRDHGDYVLLGRTRDDAAGEAFDKCARLMGLEYPGGPAIQRAAATGNPKAVPFPRATLEGTYEFSFSGLKTAVRRYLTPPSGEDHSHVLLPIPDIAASFQEAVVDVLVTKTLLAARETGVPRVFMAGGVAANQRLRERMQEACDRAGLSLFYPPITFCTDNGAMIAATGYYHLRAGHVDNLALPALAAESLTTVRFR
jgi:N6-L-threonylcarbamoyladenine synthase